LWFPLNLLLFLLCSPSFFYGSFSFLPSLIFISCLVNDYWWLFYSFIHSFFIIIQVILLL
jgi:hypothetical protein